MWLKHADLDPSIDPAVLACVAAEAVQTYQFPVGFLADWKSAVARVVEFDKWFKAVIKGSLEDLKSIGGLKSRFYIHSLTLEKDTFPQLNFLASKAADSVIMWKGVRQLMTSFGIETGGSMTTVEWEKLEYMLAHPDRLFFTKSSDYSEESFMVWIQ